MKRWVLYVDGEEPVYFDGDDVARWRTLGGDRIEGIARMEALEVGEACWVDDGHMQRLADEQMNVCDVIGCYAVFATFTGEKLCPKHRGRPVARDEQPSESA